LSTEQSAQRRGRKKARSSSTTASGRSAGAKWPPRSNTVQRRRSVVVSATFRGMKRSSLGKRAKPVGASMTRGRSWASVGGLLNCSAYNRTDDEKEVLNQ